jgi:hypothetical protein
MVLKVIGKSRPGLTPAGGPSLSPTHRDETKKDCLLFIYALEEEGGKHGLGGIQTANYLPEIKGAGQRMKPPASGPVPRRPP